MEEIKIKINYNVYLWMGLGSFFITLLLLIMPYMLNRNPEHNFFFILIFSLTSLISLKKLFSKNDIGLTISEKGIVDNSKPWESSNILVRWENIDEFIDTLDMSTLPMQAVHVDLKDKNIYLKEVSFLTKLDAYPTNFLRGTPFLIQTFFLDIENSQLIKTLNEYKKQVEDINN